MKKRFAEAQIIRFLKETQVGVPIKELCCKHGFSDAAFYGWRAKFGGMQVDDAKRLKALAAENAKLKRLLAESDEHPTETCDGNARCGQRQAETRDAEKSPCEKSPCEIAPALARVRFGRRDCRGFAQWHRRVVRQIAHST